MVRVRALASILVLVLGSFISLLAQGNRLIDYVNPFIGTTNFGATNPGAVVPHGMMSVTPFNVMGSSNNLYDKDARWWSTPYEYYNQFFTGFSHVNLSGVGCPDFGSILVMPTSGELNVDYKKYGSTYQHEVASPAYYANYLTKYDIQSEATATPRVGVTRYTFEKGGKSNVIINLGEGLTNESGASVRFVSETELEGSKLLGNFCYQGQAVYPIYFVVRISKKPNNSGYFKYQRPMNGVEAEWDADNGKYKIYNNYRKELSGDDIGAFFSYDLEKGEVLEVRVGVSFVSCDNARQNLEAETADKSFDDLRSTGEREWENKLSRILVEGGTYDQKVIFYTALYHTLIHPNLLQDVNGMYPQMEGNKIMQSDRDRYTVFSLWDTYRNVHQFLTLVYPKVQTDMLNSMVDMYKEHGWLPKWELYGRETLTMEGDPAIPVIVDSWMKGLRDFDVKAAFDAMLKSATTKGEDNLLRPDNDDYWHLGYVPLRGKFDNSVSHALEYYVADNALADFAKALGHNDWYNKFKKQSRNYRLYYSSEFGTFRPKLPDGSFLSPFDPESGMNFEPNPGFHEGSAWNYTFFVPHDIPGMIEMMGGEKAFVASLQSVFDKGLYDPTNEPNIAYPYLFSHIKGEEWRTEKLVRELITKHFTNKPNGLPGNDDTGTMSCWAIFSMMGIYPDIPGVPEYTLTAPIFDKVIIKLDPKFYENSTLEIKSHKGSKSEGYIKSILVDGKMLETRRITHDLLRKSSRIEFYF